MLSPRSRRAAGSTLPLDTPQRQAEIIPLLARMAELNGLLKQAGQQGQGQQGQGQQGQGQQGQGQQGQGSQGNQPGQQLHQACLVGDLYNPEPQRHNPDQADGDGLYDQWTIAAAGGTATGPDARVAGSGVLIVSRDGDRL